MKDAEIKHKRSEMIFALYSAITIYGLSHVPFIALLYTQGKIENVTSHAIVSALFVIAIFFFYKLLSEDARAVRTPTQLFHRLTAINPVYSVFMLTPALYAVQIVQLEIDGAAALFLALLDLLISAVGIASLVYKGWSLRQIIVSRRQEQERIVQEREAALSGSSFKAKRERERTRKAQKKLNKVKGQADTGQRLM